jgi:death-on-curing protein
LIRYLTLGELLELHQQLIERYGGSVGIHSLGALEAVLAQPRMTFGGEDLYPTVVEKAAALSFSLILNHPFVDGNKRLGHAAMAVFLYLNGHEIEASVDEQEQVILQLAAGDLERDAFIHWLRAHVVTRTDT